MGQPKVKEKNGIVWAKTSVRGGGGQANLRKRENTNDKKWLKTGSRVGQPKEKR